MSPLLSLRGVRKSYGATVVLDGVDLELHAGEVHVVAGENGAGKSTLINILAGSLDEFEGSLTLEGRPFHPSSPSMARAAGVSTIFQELSLVPTMTVTDNLFLGRERGGALGVRRAEQRAFAAQRLATLGVTTDPEAIVETLPLAERQQIEIAKALLDDGPAARVLIMDEPSSELGEQEAELLFAQIARLREAGLAILYISHKMDEVYRLADRITVLRDGVVAVSAMASELPRERLVQAMLGRDLGEVSRAAASAHEGRRLEVRELSVTVGDRRVVDDVSFAVAAGEIVAITGLAGSGGSALLHAIFGSVDGRGSVQINGAPHASRSPETSLARGMVLVGNDRRDAGILAERSVVENAALATLERFTSFGLVRERPLRVAVLDSLRELEVRAPSPDSEINALSGGNQQKVLLVRAALRQPTVLLLDEPTRGVDIGSKHEIHARMRAWCAAGASIVAITTEHEELLAIADRVVVLHRGRIAAILEVRGRDPNEVRREVLRAAMGAAA